MNNFHLDLMYIKGNLSSSLEGIFHQLCRKERHLKAKFRDTALGLKTFQATAQYHVLN